MANPQLCTSSRYFTIREIILAFVVGIQVGLIIAVTLRNVYPDAGSNTNILVKYRGETSGRMYPFQRSDVMYDDITMFASDIGEVHRSSSSSLDSSSSSTEST